MITIRLTRRQVELLASACQDSVDWLLQSAPIPADAISEKQFKELTELQGIFEDILRS